MRSTASLTWSASLALALGLPLLDAAGAQAQGAQTEIDWLEEVSEPQRKSDSAAPTAGGVAKPGAGASERSLKLRAGASMFSRYELRRNYEGLEPVAPADRIRSFDAFAYRARIVLGTERIRLSKGLGLDLAVSPQASGYWAPSGGDDDQPALALYEGYLRPWFGERAWLQVGRFAMSYGDEWLFGANDWHQAGRSFDGARFHLNAEKNAAFFDVFFTALREGRPALAAPQQDRVGAGDELMLGLYGDLGPLISDKLHLDPYALLIIAPRTRQLDDGSGTPVRREAAYQGTVGMRIRGAYGIVDYRLEGGAQFGEVLLGQRVVSQLAGAGDAEIGFALPGTVRLAAEGQFASGDDPTTSRNEGWIDRFSTPHKWLGFSDMIRTRSNVMGMAAIVSAAPVNGLDFGLQAHFLFKHRTLQVDDAGTGASPRAAYAGTELDPYIGWEIGPGLLLRSEYAAFIPSTGTYGDHKAAHYFGLQLGYTHPG